MIFSIESTDAAIQVYTPSRNGKSGVYNDERTIEKMEVRPGPGSEQVIRLMSADDDKYTDQLDIEIRLSKSVAKYLVHLLTDLEKGHA